MTKSITFIELIAVLMILGILAAVVIPKFIDLRGEARQSTCEENAAAIRGALVAYYGKTLSFPPFLDEASFTENYFAEEILPSCPFGTAYSYDSTTGSVTGHSHL